MCIRDRIIPEVVSVKAHKPDSKPYQMPEHCPSCGSKVQREPGEAALRCDNTPVSYTHLDVYKRQEINEAYDTIMNDRKARANNGGYQQNGYGGYQGGYQSGASYGRSTEYSDVRNLLMNGRIADAEQILDGVPAGRRGGEWYFLKGTCLYKKGWMEEAYNNFSTACNMEMCIRDRHR